MSKHTPGPWSTDVADSGDLFRYVGHHDAAGEWHPLCRTSINGNPNAEADARLIAKAPELLEALKALADDAHRDSYQARRAAAWRLIRRIEGAP